MVVVHDDDFVVVMLLLFLNNNIVIFLIFFGSFVFPFHIFLMLQMIIMMPTFRMVVRAIVWVDWLFSSFQFFFFLKNMFSFCYFLVAFEANELISSQQSNYDNREVRRICTCSQTVTERLKLPLKYVLNTTLKLAGFSYNNF